MIGVPTPEECFYLIEKHEVMDHIREHCRKVAEVAVFLAEQLETAGLVLNTDLIKAAALLHDIAKLRALEEGVNHAELGAAILDGAGYPAIASIVKQHVCLSSPVTGTPISEAEIVNYADKRVLHTTVVGLKERRNCAPMNALLDLSFAGVRITFAP